MSKYSNTYIFNDLGVHNVVIQQTGYYEIKCSMTLPEFSQLIIYAFLNGVPAGAVTKAGDRSIAGNSGDKWLKDDVLTLYFTSTSQVDVGTNKIKSVISFSQI